MWLWHPKAWPHHFDLAATLVTIATDSGILAHCSGLQGAQQPGATVSVSWLAACTAAVCHRRLRLSDNAKCSNGTTVTFRWSSAGRRHQPSSAAIIRQLQVRHYQHKFTSWWSYIRCCQTTTLRQSSHTCPSTWLFWQSTVFTARRSYASAVLAVVILSVRLSVRLSFTRLLCD